jgi:hypothetical protein
MWDTTDLNEMCPLGFEARRSKAVVSHISQKTSEMWGTRSFVAEPDFEQSILFLLQPFRQQMVRNANGIGDDRQ